MPEIIYEVQPEEIKPLEVLDDDGNLILPSSIDTSQHFWGAFGDSETEDSANFVVRLCQEKGNWLPFTNEEIDALYKKTNEKSEFKFNSLVDSTNKRQFGGGKSVVDGGWLSQDGDKYLVTQNFVRRAYKSSPVKK